MIPSSYRSGANSHLQSPSCLWLALVGLLLPSSNFAQEKPAIIASSADNVQRRPSVSSHLTIRTKLARIRLDSVSFDNLPLSEVVNFLSTETKRRDPEGKGINFILNPRQDFAAPAAVDPATGLPVASAKEGMDINNVSIRIVPALTDIRLADLLDVIVDVSGKTIKYSVEDYAIVFRLDPSPLYTRTFKVPPGTFSQGLQSVVGVSVGNFSTGSQGGGGGGQQGNGNVSVPQVQVSPNTGGAQGGQAGGQNGGGIEGVTRPSTNSSQLARQFLVNMGIDMNPPKSVFYNDRTGTMVVRATPQDIGLIRDAIGAP